MADQFLECQRDLLRLQRGVITRRQVGLTEKAIVVRLQSGRWQRLHQHGQGRSHAPARLWDVSGRNCESATLVSQTLQRRGWQGMLRRCGCSCRALS